MLNIEKIQDEIIDQYLYDENTRPWIIGFSGGKDSTMLLQVVWYSLMKIPAELRSRQIYVICNNTLVENPKILQYTEGVLNKIQKAAVEQSIPISVNRTTPKLEDTFWINLLGKGYPAPNNIFRWCTERLKINPTSQFIMEKVNENGEVIILLGTRYAESSSRSRSMKKHDIEGKRLKKHLLPNAFAYTPIKDVLTEEVWQYLLQVNSPWGSSNRELVILYRNAESGDCPLVLDKTTPSCGNSRFGCWVCTVVNRDKSMEALIENGEDWMYPLMELRDLLAESRNRFDWREERRRNNVEGAGPYKPHIRAMFLEKLLKAQKDIQESQGDVELISFQELVAIQVIWYRDSIFEFKVSEIYQEVFGYSLDLNTFNYLEPDEQIVLNEVCKDNIKDIDLVNELLLLQKSKILFMKSRGIHNDLEKRIEQFLLEN